MTRKVRLSYVFDAPASGRGLGNPLIELLQAVRATGSITGAAAALGLSYRHTWGELRRWEAQLDRSLIVWNKGQPAQLTPFGEKLLWAERMAQARLAPQLEAVHAELERAFAVAFDDASLVQTVFASHDHALTRLRAEAARSRLHLDVQFFGSVDAISALDEGRCTVAGFHARGDGALARAAYQPLLVPGRHKLIGFAERTQGLIVAAGNPLGLQGLADVVAREARFANRALGTGTRLLLDELLQEAAILPAAMRGYRDAHPSQHAVAQAIAAGSADAALGIEAVAQTHGLSFVPLAQERYYLVCLREALETESTRALRQVLQSEAWRSQLATLPGYTPWRCGEVLSLKACLPWWKLPPKPSVRAA